jgi:hypothetical protein
MGHMTGRRTAMALIGALLILVPAHAQTPPPTKGPEGKRLTGAVITPQRVNDQIEEWAKKRQDQGPTARVANFFLFFAATPAEFNALGRYSVLLLTVVTQKAEELPLTRVYIRAKEQDVAMQKVSSWRSDVDSALLTHKIYGPYREAGFYLVPTGMTMRDGQLLADFAANRTGLPILQLPNKGAPDRLRALGNLDPPPNAKPTLKALQGLITRATSGFPVPTSVP